MYRLLYVLRNTFLLLKSTKRIALVTIISIFIGMVALGSTYIVGTKLFSSSLTLREKVRITVFFKQNTQKDDVNNSVSTIASIDGVKDVKLTTPDEAKADFIQVFPQYKGLFEDLNKNPLPYSATVELKDIGLGKRISDVIQSLPTVDIVVFSEDTMNKVNQLITAVWLIFISVLLAVLGEFIFTVQNSTTLLLDYRRSDVRVLKLIGADSMFTFLPFVLISIILSLVSWWGSFYLIREVDKLSGSIVQGIIPYATVTGNVNLFYVMSMILLIALVSSVIGSLLSILRFRNVQ